MNNLAWERVVTGRAGTAVGAGQAVKLGADELEFDAATTATDLVIGFARQAAAANEEVEVNLIGGFAKARASGTAIGKGALCKLSGTTGHLVGTTTDDDQVCAVAMEAIAANGTGTVYVTTRDV